MQVRHVQDLHIIQNLVPHQVAVLHHMIQAVVLLAVLRIILEAAHHLDRADLQGHIVPEEEAVAEDQAVAEVLAAVAVVAVEADKILKRKLFVD